MFDTLLIANRGEIACRVIRTARRMGLRTVAVFSKADAHSLHAEMADTAVAIGPAPAAESYLRSDRILEAAARTGAQAIHPGYGFLSENAGFAEACTAAGVTFVGPPPNALRAMGSKSEAKRLMTEAGVPLVPGYHGDDQGLETLAEAADRIGYPVLVKASSGGGGKGMRAVQGPSVLRDAVDGAKREAKAAFGDDRLLIEKYLDRPRHVEVQVFADTHGEIIHLFERDCSIQRRHQKVLEEAPAPDLPPPVRRSLWKAAIAAARAVGYVGAGTVEFLTQDGAVYFMEMNTRLQVEHPVTEMITGLDLVEWQLRVAAGEPLPRRQDQVTCTGHALEVRVYAEDPDKDFLPAIGRLTHLRPPPESEQIRIDTGVRAGDSITVHYDPMIAKLIVHGADRRAAMRRLTQALDGFEVAGLANNLPFLRTLSRHPAFADAELDTRFIDRHRATLIPGPQPVPPEVLALAALALLLQRGNEARRSAEDTADPHSPWRLATGWRLNSDHHQVYRFLDPGLDQETAPAITVHFRSDGWTLDLPTGSQVSARNASYEDGRLSVLLDGQKRNASILATADGVLTVWTEGREHRFMLDDPATRIAKAEAGSGRLSAPMPGTLVRVMVEEGQTVTRGTPLLVVEAMKMEHTITAPADGTITALPRTAGDQVFEGEPLVVFEASPS